MRILKIHFANLNSLYGEWEIDLSTPAYMNDGIFAITGPTGSGKSTILDAVCLALYGRTPRLDSIGGQSNEIMSRQRAQCFASVTFETRHGMFRCTWEQHRARNKVDGNLVDSTCEIVDVATAEILFTKKREVAQAVEQYTGMTFERFTRSMLLAQGDFAAFLRANADQRSPILEQITGTEIYSLISQKVHTLRKEQADTLERMLSDVKAYEPLSKDEHAHLLSELELVNLWEAGAERRYQAANSAIAMLQKLERLRTRRKELEAQHITLEQDRIHITPLIETYRLALAALELEPVYRSLCGVRESLKAERVSVTAHQKHQDELAVSRQEVEKTVRLALQNQTDAQEAWRAAQEPLTEARKMIMHITHLQSHADELRKALVKARRNRRFVVKDVLDSTRERETLAAQVEEAVRWLKSHDHDAHVEKVLTTIRDDATQLRSLQERKQHHAENREAAKTRLAALEKSAKAAREVLAGYKEGEQRITKKMEQRQVAIAKLLNGQAKREYVTELEHLQEKELLLARITSLVEQRNQLEDGKPCPVCGSVHHPYAEGSLPSASEHARRMTSVRHLLAKLNTEEELLKSIEVELTQQQQQIGVQQATVDSIDGQIGETKETWQKIESQFEEDSRQLDMLWDRLCQTITPFVDHSLSLEHIFETIEDIEKRSKVYADVKRDRFQGDARLEQLTKERMRLSISLGNAQEEVKDVIKRLDQDRSDLAKLSQSLETLLAGNDVDAWETALREDVEHADAYCKKQQETLNRYNRETDSLAQSIAMANERIGQLESQQEQLQRGFLEALAGHGFVDEEQFRKARCEQQERHRLERLIDEFEKREHSLQLQTDEVDRQKKESESEYDPAWNLQKLQMVMDDAKDERSRLDQRRGAVKERLEIDGRKRDVHGKKLDEIERQRTVFHGYDRLNSLIGSHDGKRFRNFAQGLTFELLINHANAHLKSLSSRYILVADPSHPLDVAVMDLYQAGQVRSSKNLSGGESFLVSLALSLGLSTIASKRVQVDSLFLDEGFGTLDEQTLEMALDALSALRNQGKLVGIISHVGALQERIPVQISVVPLSGGMSKLVGPGCSNLS